MSIYSSVGYLIKHKLADENSKKSMQVELSNYIDKYASTNPTSESKERLSALVYNTVFQCIKIMLYAGSFKIKQISVFIVWEEINPLSSEFMLYIGKCIDINIVIGFKGFMTLIKKETENMQVLLIEANNGKSVICSKDLQSQCIIRVQCALPKTERHYLNSTVIKPQYHDICYHGNQSPRSKISSYTDKMISYYKIKAPQSAQIKNRLMRLTQIKTKFDSTNYKRSIELTPQSSKKLVFKTLSDCTSSPKKSVSNFYEFKAMPMQRYLLCSSKFGSICGSMSSRVSGNSVSIKYSNI